MSETQTSERDPNLLNLAGLLLGGLVLAFGIRSFYWSFGWAGHECLNCDLSSIGNTAIDDLSFLPAADYSFGFTVAGVLMLVILNAGAWRRTGGY
ncbi:MAG: hypothetical protein ABMB14_23875 [Myxococcota bacterium]